MKNTIIIFVIGVLVGAVIATGAFYIYTTTSNTCNNTQNMEMNGGTPPSMPNGQPPEKPSGDNGNTQEMPNNNSQSSN